MSNRLSTRVALFALLCLAWGSGWLALKIGVAALPPLFFAASRFVAAGAILLGVSGVFGGWRGWRSLRVRALLPGALLMVAVNYGLMAWGAARASSGLAAVVNLTTIPIALAVCGALYSQTRFTRRAGIGLALGTCGLTVLLAVPEFRNGSGSRSSDVSAVLGLAAISVGAVCYAWGSLLTRRHFEKVPALAVSTFQALAGGGALLAVSALCEPWNFDRAAVLDPVRFGGWLFLVAISVVSTPIYLWLLARWEPNRVAAYAYICPVIAIAEGVAFGAEHFGALQAAGALLLGAGAYGVLGRPPLQNPARSAVRLGGA